VSKEPQEAIHSGKRITEFNPATTRSGWLPKGLWSDLDELHARHEEAIANVARSKQEAMELGQRFRAEDAERQEAYKTGLTVPKMTDPGKRERLVAEARDKVRAAEAALPEVVAEVVAAVQAHEAEWSADLDAKFVTAENKVEEAQRLLDEANLEQAKVNRTRSWLRRTAHNRQGRHVSIDNVGLALPAPSVSLTQIREGGVVSVSGGV
jgi:hypothetical protein